MNQPSAQTAAMDTWQAMAGATRIIVILDASHDVERKLLEEFLAQNVGEHGVTAQIEHCWIPIVNDPENPPVDNLQSLLELPSDTAVLPLRVVWRTSLEKKSTRPRARDLLFGNPRRPSPRRAERILEQNPRRAVCIAGASATLEELRSRMIAQQGDDVDEQAFAPFIALQAGLALDVAERLLSGSRYKVPRSVDRSLLASSKFRGALQEVSQATGRSMDDLLRESEQIMRELISRPQPFWLDVMAQLNHRVMELGYDADVVLDNDGMERVRQWSREYPTALLWTHKTHVDGFAVNSVCFDNDFPAPHILGGVNMAFAGLGFLARRAGAIFIRRSFQDDPLYKTVLRQYIGYLMEKRFPLSWAFEGTRSRVGKLMPPRYGLLKYVMDSAHATGARNLHIIPISISYDMIGDVKDYAVEQSGAVKRPESLSWFLGYLRGLRQPMGKIYFNFGEPVVLDRVPSPEDPRELQRVAFAVGVEANRVTPITLPSLICMVLLGAAPRALTGDELRDQLEALRNWASERRLPMTSELEERDEERISTLIRYMINAGLLTLYEDGPEPVFTIANEQHGVASYYRNTVMHFFLPKAIAELALTRMAQSKKTGVDYFRGECERLRDFFKFEFFYAPTDEFLGEVDQELSRVNNEWTDLLEREGGADNLLGSLAPYVAHSVLLPFVEAYRVVADVLARQEPGTELNEKDCVQEALAYGRQAFLQRRISSEASIGKLLFSNGYRLFDNQNLISRDQAAGSLREKRLETSKTFRLLQRRLERVRAAALP
ncbi:MAG: glycerol-3-phosphate 1-O-acyltransferase [Pseudomonadota bacterium]